MPRQYQVNQENEEVEVTVQNAVFHAG